MTSSERFFSTDYFTARNRFRELVGTVSGRLETISIDAKGSKGEDLSIDIAWFGVATPRRVLLHSSGLHGVEGFAGSAIQLQLMNTLPTLSKDSALIIVHVLNSYGMAWLRRFNENNVDLNRNFLADESYSDVPPTYAQLDPFLNPQSPPASDLFTVKAGWLIMRHGMPALKQAVVGGQYEYEKGLFFGGKRLEQGPEKYQTFLAARLASAEQIVAIDVHTGLGKYGDDTLLVDEKNYETVRRVFGERASRQNPDLGPAYLVRGGLEHMVPRAVPKAKVISLTQEFGTYGPTKVLHALREENRWHHYGEATPDHPTKRRLKETFYPQDETWQDPVLKRGKEMVKEALSQLR